jgi:hypothetical protein
VSGRLNRLALRAYPAAYRRERGAEILATLEDLGAEGRSSRQLLALLVAGLRTRAGLRASWHRRGAVADGLRIGAAVVVGGYALMVASDAWQVGDRLGLWLVAAAWLLATGGLLAGTRLAIPLVLAAPAASVSWWVHNGVGGAALEFAALEVAAVAVPAVVALVVAGRLEPKTLRLSPFWLLAVLPQALLLSGALHPPAHLFISSSVEAVTAVMLLAALALAPVDPRPAVAACVVMTTVVAWIAAVSALGIYSWIAPVPFVRLIDHALPVVVVLAAGARVGLQRLSQPV